jgi:cytochrome oxidase Cu insertion factor (SCO1/SenC/PrrC family)
MINDPNNSQLDKKRLWRGRLLFLLIVSAFVLPFAGAWWLYSHTESGRPWAGSNKGDLINPAEPLQAFVIEQDSDEVFTLENLQHQWTLVFIPPPVCEELCLKNIYHMRQVWAGLGREAPRVQRLMILQSAAQKDDLREFLENYPYMTVIIDSESVLVQQMISSGKQVHDNIFLVDPLGNLMIAFPQTLDPRDMLKDLKKLLKISTIG